MKTQLISILNLIKISATVFECVQYGVNKPFPSAVKHVELIRSGPLQRSAQPIRFRSRGATVPAVGLKRFSL